MIYDSLPDTFLDAHPLPALLTVPRENGIVMANAGALAQFGHNVASSALSDLLTSDPADVVVYLDAVEHFGRYVDRTLKFADTSQRPLNLQTIGQHLGHGRFLLSFLDLDELNQRNRAMEQEAHHKSGLSRWKDIYGFFREVEAQNHLILEAAGEGIYGINSKGEATFVNRAAQEMLGWSADDLIGCELHPIIHHKHLNGDHFPAQACPIYESFRKDQTMRVDDDVFWRKDGKPIMVEYVSTPIYDNDVLAGAVVIFRDVTERRENERKLRDALAQVEELKIKLEQENDYLLTEIRSARTHAGVVGVSAAIKSLNAQIDLAAKNNAHVLVSGPPGSGKGMTVSAIHEASSRNRRPLIRINCSESNAQGFETELFGHKRGAFPGATHDQTGKLLMANNSTLHLDEVADLPKTIQARLHDVLQSGKFKRPGDSIETPVDLAVIATSSRDLSADVRAGRFRQDLYFTLNLFSIQCEPLSSRPEDIPYLAQHFLDGTTRRLRLPKTRLSRANIDILKQYSWPGNVRELKNVVERAAILAQGGRLQFDFQLSGPSPAQGSDVVMTQKEMRDFEYKNLESALRRTKGKVAGEQGAAAMLGMAPTTVYSRIKTLGIELSRFG